MDGNQETLKFRLDFNIIANIAHEVGKGISDFVMPHVGVSTLCTVKGVGKVRSLTTCTCEFVHVVKLTCACGQTSDLTHGLHCAKGGYTYMRHDEIRDTFANLKSDVCLL